MNSPQFQPNSDPNKIAKRTIQPDLTPRQIQQPPVPAYQSEEFDRSVLLQQSQWWSRGIIWTILGVTTGLVTWACFAPLEEAVPAQGKLEPIDKVKDVQVPMPGVVKTSFVKEGDKVQAGQKLLSLESIVPQSQLISLQNNLASLTAETQFYRTVLSQGIAAVSPEELAKLNVNPEILALTKNRSSILGENQLYRAELNGTNLANFNAEQLQRLQSSRAELVSRMSSGKLEIGQVENQMRENRFKRQGLNTLLLNSQATIANFDAKSKAKASQIESQLAENTTKHATSKSLLKTNEGILNSLRPAANAGALSRNQVLKQEQEVTARTSEVAEIEQQYNRLQGDRQELIATSRLEIQNQQQQIEEYQNQIGQLDQEYNRLKMATNQSREKLKNSFASSQKELLTRIGDNDKRIAEIDGQLNRFIVENERKIADTTSQIAQATQNLKYQDIVAPVSGTVFELKAGTPGFVANPAEPVLKIVPDNKLTAKVFITNKDIGFVKVGMPVDVRIDSFPFSEFGDVKGKLKSIGSDSLPADQAHPYERFPATIELDKQNLIIKGNPVTIQSGMSLSANIKLRERTVMSIFTDMVMKQGDALKTVR
jgi:hemolysin D